MPATFTPALIQKADADAATAVKNSVRKKIKNLTTSIWKPKDVDKYFLNQLLEYPS